MDNLEIDKSTGELMIFTDSNLTSNNISFATDEQQAYNSLA
jgi:hypothetical protein